MQKAKSKLITGQAVCWLLLWGGSVSGLQSPLAGASDAMPPGLDQPAVQRLLDTVTQDHNANTLKYGYFIGHRRQPLPVAEGYGLLKAAVEREPAGTQRWFVLQSVLAFAAFRVGVNTVPEGYAAYDTLFSRAGAAVPGNAAPVVENALYDFAITLSGNYAKSSRRGGHKVDDSLRQALQVYLALPNQDVATALEVPWEGAVEQADDTSLLRIWMEKKLAAPDTPKTFRLLRTAATLYQAVKPERALELLRQAKLLLPRQNPKLVNSFYESLVDLLANTGKLHEAITAQQERVQLTGHGYARLTMLAAQNKEEQTLSATLAALATPTTDERELNDTAASLLASYQDKADAQAVTLLQQYLTGQRPRDVEQELRARLTLGQYFIRHKKLDEAKAALAIEHIRPPLPTRFAQAYYDAAQQMRQDLNLKAQNIKKDVPVSQKENP